MSNQFIFGVCWCGAFFFIGSGLHLDNPLFYILAGLLGGFAAMQLSRTSEREKP